MEDDNSGLHTRLGNIFVKYHFFILYLLLVVLAIVNGATEMASALYLVVMVAAVIWFGLVFINGNYLRLIHTARAAINTLVLLVVMILMLLQSINVSNPSQTSAPAIIGVAILYISLFINVGIVARIEYKRRRSKNINKI